MKASVSKTPEITKKNLKKLVTTCTSGFVFNFICRSAMSALWNKYTIIKTHVKPENIPRV